MKIINVLNDDTLAEILDVFRQAPAGEVIFVLPRSCAIFRKDDHFAVFASEAKRGNKTISLLSADPKVNAMARAYEFTIMHAGKALRGKAKLASAPPPADADIQDTNEDAFQTDVAVPSDERMGIEGPDEVEDVTDPLHGFQVEDETGTPLDEHADEQLDEPQQGDVMLTMARTAKSGSIPVKTVAPTRAMPIPVTPRSEAAADIDYIDAVWRQKAARQHVATPTMTDVLHRRSWKRFFRLPTGFGSLRSSKWLVTGAVVFAAVLLTAAVYLTVGSASVDIVPASHAVDTQLDVQVSDVFTSIDENFAKLPGQLFEVTKAATVQQAATGTRDVASKARVRLTISNEYSSTPQTLVATTRFVHPNGMMFRTLQTVTVPGSTVKEGKAVAGTVMVDAIADKPGPTYNVAAGKWIVVAFQERGDTQRANQIYGTSTEAATGGTSGPSSVVTQADYDAAQTAAVAQVKAAIADAFASQQTGLRILDEAAPDVDSVVASAHPDDAAASVSITATATLRTVAFRPADLEKLVHDTILQKDRLETISDQLNVTISNVVFEPDAGVLKFSAAVTGPGYEPVDVDAIRSDLHNKNSQQVRDYFAQREGIASATVALRPFWVRRVPEKDSHITIHVIYQAPDASR